MSDSVRQSRCSVCDADHAAPFFETATGTLPVLSCALFSTSERARECERRPVRLACCTTCGFVENVVFDAQASAYSEVYENALHFSRVYRRYAESEAKRLVDRLDLRSKRIVEVGCGDGRFLSLLCELGDNTGVGFDPSYGDQKRTTLELHPSVDVVPEYFSEQHADLHPDLVLSRHVLEHIPDPLRFMRMLRGALQTGAHLFFEVPDGRFLIEQHSLWDVIYEHCSYFTPASLERLFADAGFRVDELRSTFDGQCLTIEATAAAAREAHAGASGDDVRRLTARARDFGHAASRRLADCTARLEELSGRRVALWGAGARAVVYMNMVGSAADTLGHVVDINPRKQGFHLPGTGLRVDAPDSLPAFDPEVVLIMNRIYEREIGDALGELGVKASLEVV